MITLRRAADRGHADLGWLDSWHTFSFSSYYDPKHMGFRSLRVINDDRIAAGKGFGTHGHQDMEIITYVLDGELEHKDSMGSGSVLRPGDVQHMSAGTGVMHSEFNHSRSAPVHLLQIWIEPDEAGIPPVYGERNFPVAQRSGQLRLVASRDGRDGSLRIHQDVDLMASLLAPGQTVTHALRPGRHAWVQMAKGSAVVNGAPLSAGDAAAISAETTLRIEGSGAGAGPAELLVFDLP
jgi:redox-sensitive bicupin YhaK (pirin superfamily)